MFRCNKHYSKILQETLSNAVSNDLLPFMIGQSHDSFTLLSVKDAVVTSLLTMKVTYFGWVVVTPNIQTSRFFELQANTGRQSGGIHRQSSLTKSPLSPSPTLSLGGNSPSRAMSRAALNVKSSKPLCKSISCRTETNKQHFSTCT
jgi:hypothetical protein